MSFPDKTADTRYGILPLIAGRWSPRAFADKAVEDEKLLRLFEAARWAPSSSNEQPWRFIVAKKGEAHYERLLEGINESNRKWVWTAPVLGFTIAARTFARNGMENQHRRHDIGLAMGNLLAQATAEGLFVHQMAGIHPEKVMKNFNIDAESYEVVTGFVIGYFDPERLQEMEERYRQSEVKARSRRGLEETVFGTDFGEKAAWI